jgi:hypothetical protein
MGFEPRSGSEKTLYDQQLGVAPQFWNSRRIRTAIAAHGIPALEWVALISGSWDGTPSRHAAPVEHEDPAPRRAAPLTGRRTATPGHPDHVATWGTRMVLRAHPFPRVHATNARAPRWQARLIA